MSRPERAFFSDDSFKCLFDNYKNRVYGYVLTITRNPYSAEEITQEIFIKLLLSRQVEQTRISHLKGVSFAANKNEYFPIPQKEIGLNHNLVQNQGY